MLNLLFAVALRVGVEKRLASKPVTPALAKAIKREDARNRNFC